MDNKNSLIAGTVIIFAIVIGLVAVVANRNQSGESRDTNQVTQTIEESSLEPGQDAQLAQEIDDNLSATEPNNQTQVEPESVEEDVNEATATNSLPNNWGELSLQQQITLNPHNCDLTTQWMLSDGTCKDKETSGVASEGTTADINPRNCNLTTQRVLEDGTCKDKETNDGIVEDPTITPQPSNQPFEFNAGRFYLSLTVDTTSFRCKDLKDPYGGWGSIDASPFWQGFKNYLKDKHNLTVADSDLQKHISNYKECNLNIVGVNLGPDTAFPSSCISFDLEPVLVTTSQSYSPPQFMDGYVCATVMVPFRTGETQTDALTSYVIGTNEQPISLRFIDSKTNKLTVVSF